MQHRAHGELPSKVLATASLTEVVVKRVANIPAQATNCKPAD